MELHRARARSRLTFPKTRRSRLARSIHGGRTRPGQQDRRAYRAAHSRSHREGKHPGLPRGPGLRLDGRNTGDRRFLPGQTGLNGWRMVLRRLLDDPGGWSLENGSDAGQLVCSGRISRWGAFSCPSSSRSRSPGSPPHSCRTRRASCWSASGRSFRAYRSAKARSASSGLRGQVEFLKATVKFIAVAVVVLVILQSDQLRVMSAHVHRPCGRCRR